MIYRHFFATSMKNHQSFSCDIRILVIKKIRTHHLGKLYCLPERREQTFFKSFPIIQTLFQNCTMYNLFSYQINLCISTYKYVYFFQIKWSWIKSIWKKVSTHPGKNVVMGRSGCWVRIEIGVCIFVLEHFPEF